MRITNHASAKSHTTTISCDSHCLAFDCIGGEVNGM